MLSLIVYIFQKKNKVNMNILPLLDKSKKNIYKHLTDHIIVRDIITFNINKKSITTNKNKSISLLLLFWCDLL